MLFFHEQCLHSSRCATAYTYTNGYLRFMPAANILLRGLPARGSLQAPAGLDWALFELPGDLLRLRLAYIGRLLAARGSLQAPAGLDWALFELPGDLLRLRLACVGLLYAISATGWAHDWCDWFPLKA